MEKILRLIKGDINTINSFFFLFLVSLFSSLPFLINPRLVLNRNNDLENFFWPIFFYTKQRFLENGEIPLWNNLFFSGMPLISDPQSQIFYPPNIIFYLLPINFAFIVSIIFHILLGGIGILILTKKVFKFSSIASLFTASAYIMSPKISGYIEAGHFGLIESFAWVPFCIISLLKLVKNPSPFWSILLSVSLAGIFFAHTITFIITLVFALIIYIFLIFYFMKLHKKQIFYFTLGLMITFGLVAITLLPQLEWLPTTTRSLLLKFPDTYPKWQSFHEFIFSLLFPWKLGIANIDSEKWIAPGVTLSIFAFIGFLFINRTFKLLIFSTLIIIFLISLNNLSPIYPILYSKDFFILMRVETRFFFILHIIIILLAGFAFNTIYKRFSKKNVIFFILLFVFFELTTLSWSRLTIPVNTNLDAPPNEVYQFLKQDKERFRVFCITRCLSQKEAAINDLELVEGYNTIQQKNYFDYFIQLSQVYWNKYSLALPPFEIYLFREIQPYAPALSEYNIKYVISPYALKDKRLIFKKRFGRYFIYQNAIVLPRAYFTSNDSKDKEAPIIKYSPNEITVDTKRHLSENLILSEVYSPGWKAYLNGKEETQINQTSNMLRVVKIKPATNSLDFRYQPESFLKGTVLTIFTIILICFLFLRQKLFLLKLRQQK